MHPWARLARPIPLEELWDRQGTILPVRPRSWLSAANVASLLRAATVKFIVVNPGNPLRWIPPEETFTFWKSEVKPRLVDPSRFDGWSIEDYPGEHCYRAQEWREERNPDVVYIALYHDH
jgi:hypothetical protein